MPTSIFCLKIEWSLIFLLHGLLMCCFLLQVNEDSGNRRPIMLEAVDNPNSGASTSRRDEAASSLSGASVAGIKGSGEDFQSASHEKPNKKAKKDKQDKEMSGKDLSWRYSDFHLGVEK